MTVDSGFAEAKRHQEDNHFNQPPEPWDILGPGNEVEWPGFSSVKTFHPKIAHAHQNNRAMGALARPQGPQVVLK